MRLYSNQQRPFTEILHIGVAITVVRAGQQHLGILHKDESAGEVKLSRIWRGTFN